MDPDVEGKPACGRILVVCTGNVCRSPYIERVLVRELADTRIRVSSAGTGAMVGGAIDPQSAALVASAGANEHDFAARQITRGMVREADLVIGAAREHLGTVVQLFPRALSYSFALRDLSDLVANVSDGDIAGAAGDNRVAKVAAVAIARRGTVSPRMPANSGIIDPFRRDASAFKQMADEVGSSLPNVVMALRGT